MDVLVAIGVGLGVGTGAGFVVAVLQIIGKRLRNARLAKRGEPPYRDVILLPFWWAFGPIGAIAAGAGAALGSTLLASGLAAAALPALWLVLSTIALIAQLLR